MHVRKTAAHRGAARPLPKALPTARPFAVTYPGEEIASSPTNPFPPRPHEVWMGEQASQTAPDLWRSPIPETTTPALDWNRISLYAKGQASVAQPRLVPLLQYRFSAVPTLQRTPPKTSDKTQDSKSGNQTDEDAALQDILTNWKLPDGMNYQLQGNTIVIRRSWLVKDGAYSSTSGASHAPTAATTILRHLREIGKFAWITDDIIAEAAPKLTFFGEFPPKFPYKPFPIASDIYELIGPPPTSDDITWSRYGSEGLTYIVHGHLFQNANANRLQTVAKRIVDALEAFTGLKVLPNRRSAVVQVMVQVLTTAQQRGLKAVARDVDREGLEAAFGVPAWSSFIQQTADEEATTQAGAKGTQPFDPDVPPGDRKFFKDFMAKHFKSATPTATADQPGQTVNAYLIAALKKLDKHPQKNQILALMQGGGKQSAEALTAASVENAINAAEMQAVYKDLKLEMPKTADDKWKPIINAPVQGEIMNRSGRLHAGEDAEFGFEVSDRADALRVPHLTIKWVATPQGKSTNHLKTETTSQIDLPGEKPDYFDVTFDKPGLYTVHAFVYHNFYQPAHFSIPVEVKTEAQRMSELRTEAFAGMGRYDTIIHDFDTSTFNETFGKEKYDKGSQFTGRLPKNFKRRSFEERIQFITDERQRLESLVKQYGSSNKPSHQEIAKYASDYLKTLDTAYRTLTAESLLGHSFFDVRATFLSRQSGIPDKPLHLVCSAKKDGNNVVVTLHDHTKLYEAVDYTFTGSAGSFTAALESAFLSLCKSYPPGRVSFLAETLGDRELTPTQSTLGFELDTGTAWKSLKSTVFSPVAQMAVNILGAALMIFVPVTAPVVFPMLVAYNATDTIDNLINLQEKGNLKWEEVAKGVAMIGLDLLPYLGRAKMFMKTGSKAIYVIEGIEIASQVVLMTDAGIEQVKQIRNQDVREIAELQAQVTTLERTNPSHPNLSNLKATLQTKIKATQDRSEEVFSKMALMGGVMLVPSVVFSKLAAGRHAQKVEELLATGLFEHQAGVKPHFDPKTGKAYIDKATATPEQLDALKAEILKHQQATGHIEKPLADEPSSTTPPAETPDPKPTLTPPESKTGGKAGTTEPKLHGEVPGSKSTESPKVTPESAIADLKAGLSGKDRHAKVAQAEAAIATTQDFKQLRQKVNSGELGDPAQAAKALQSARMKVIYQTFREVKQALKAEFRAKGAKLKIKAKNLGTPGFASDCDITIHVSGSKNVNDDIAASVKASKAMYEKLRSRGLDPDKALDANFYTELHEGRIKPKNKAEASAIVADQSVVSLAEMRMNMSDDQWQAYVKAQRESLSQGQSLDGPARDVSTRSQQRMDEQIQQAEALAKRLQQGDRDQLLQDRQQALLDAIERGASAQEKRQLMAEIKLLEPDAYGTRAAVEGVVDYQQAIARGDASTYMKTNRHLPDSKAEQFAVHAQEGSASLGKLSHVTAHITGNANYGGVRSAAKYLNRIHDALFRAGLKVEHPLLDTLTRVIKTKQGPHADIYTVYELQNSRWAKERGLTDVKDKELCDAFLKEAQELGQQMVVKLRSHEQSMHVFENPPPKAAKSSSKELSQEKPEKTLNPVAAGKDPFYARNLGLSDRATKALAKLENLKQDPVGEINSQTKHNHYKAARREAAGEIVATRPQDGKPYSHIGDLQRACDGLYKVRDALEEEIRVPPNSITARGIDILDAKFREVRTLIDQLNGFLGEIGHAKFPPYHEWKPGAKPGTWKP